MVILLLIEKKICLGKIKPSICLEGFFIFGWGTWDRTKECLVQSQMPYRLAIPQLVCESYFDNTWNFFLEDDFY